MNGFIATPTLPRRAAFRAVLIGALCVSSVLLIGAVRDFQPGAIAVRPDAAPPIAAAVESDTDEVFASYSSAADGRELLVENPSSPVTAAVTVAAEPKPTAPRLNPPVLPSLVERVALPTLAPRTRVMMMEVTAYCPCTKCCGPRAQGITASGKRVSYNGGKFVAADTRLLKFHTNLIVPGYASGQPVPVIDRGGAIKGRKLDVYFPTHQEARQWGRKKIPVTVIEE